jgi:hypothetical protein
VELVGAMTLWSLGASWFLFPLLGVPRLLRRAAAGLCAAELTCLLLWSYGSETCEARPCSAPAEAARAAASSDVPALAAALIGLAVAWGVRRMRRSRPAAPA